MPLRMAITKATANGEQFVVDVCQWNPVTGDILHSVSEMTELADSALRLGDLRLLEMNQRMLEAYNLERYFEPQIWAKIVAILDILAGRQSADTVARRWQSEIEETAELEERRRENQEELVMYTEMAMKGECTCSRFTANVPCPIHTGVRND